MHKITQKSRGFTIIELLVVMVVIGIITAATTFAYTNVRKQSRDSQRTAAATVISESLERYFDKNGEYPSIANMTVSNANLVKQLLSINSTDSLIATNAPLGSTTNIWTTGASSATSPLTYSANTDNSASCLTGAAATDVCADYKIQYYKELNATIQTIYSRHTAAAAPAAPTPPVITAPGAPTLAITSNGGNVVATRSNTSCNPGAITLYAFQSRTNGGAWSGYSAWSNNTSTSTPANQGVKYGFQVKAKCLEGDYSSSDAVSSESTYIQPINAPTVTALSNGVAGNTTTWSWPAVTCPAGTTVAYAVNTGNDYDISGSISWWGYQPDQTTTTWPRDTTSQGYNYTTVMHAKCGNANTTSGWSAESNYSSYLRPVNAPGGAYNWGYAVLNSRTIYRWTWWEPGCGQGTAQSFQWDGYIGDVNNTNGWNMYWRDKGAYNHYWYGATAPSWQDNNWYTGPVLDLNFDGASTRAGVDVYARIKYRCQNPQTLRTAEGGWAQSPGYST